MNQLTPHSTPGAAQPLRELLRGVADVSTDVLVRDLTIDSRAVRPGSVFVALAGTREHGLRYARHAVANGAVAMLFEPGANAGEVPGDVPAIAVADLRERLGAIADRFFDAPSAKLRVVGVTGTNGKTTTGWIMASAAEALGEPAAYAGTLGFGRAGAVTARPHTTPDCITVHRELASMQAEGASTVAMEVTSHALDQARVAGVRFEGAVFTNLTHDHLDYHGTFEQYGAAKAKLFAWPGLRHAVINADDAFGRTLVASCAGRIATIGCTRHGDVPPGAHALIAAQIARGERGLDVQIAGDFGSAWLRSQLVGDFNVDNLLATLGVLLARGIPLQEAVHALSNVTAPPGRMQTFTRAGAPLAIVDYAHTPDALEKALHAARRHTTGRLWCVFGCGGERDATKRPVMGRIASELADEAVITDDNPRGEDGQAIVDQIVAGATARKSVHVERDRKLAIELALASAHSGDVVLVAGKGHEDYQIVGTERRHFSDAEVIRHWLEKRT